MPTWVYLWVGAPLLAVFIFLCVQLVRGVRLQRRGNRGIALHRAGDHAGAEAVFRELLAEAERRHQAVLQRYSLVNLAASLIAQRRQAEARPLLQRAAALAGRRGKPRESAPALYNLAWAAFLDRDFETAAYFNGQAQAAAGNRAPVDLATLLCLMDGRLATRAGRFDGARTWPKRPPMPRAPATTTSPTRSRWPRGYSNTAAAIGPASTWLWMRCAGSSPPTARTSPRAG